MEAAWLRVSFAARHHRPVPEPGTASAHLPRQHDQISTGSDACLRHLHNRTGRLVKLAIRLHLIGHI